MTLTMLKNPDDLFSLNLVQFYIFEVKNQYVWDREREKNMDKMILLKLWKFLNILRNQNLKWTKNK